MNGTPAGWYDDPEQPGQQRYWDGNAWTEHRAPGGVARGTADPAAPPQPRPPRRLLRPWPRPRPQPPARATAMAPPPAAAPAKTLAQGPVDRPRRDRRSSSSLIIVAIAAVALLGDSTDVTGTIEENLPAELESNFAAQGLDVDHHQGRLRRGHATTTGPSPPSCAITIDGPRRARAGRRSWARSTANTVTVSDATSDVTILNDEPGREGSPSRSWPRSPPRSTVHVLHARPAARAGRGGPHLHLRHRLRRDRHLELQGGTLVLTDVQ